jgi:large subunit ribosomal protein L15
MSVIDQIVPSLLAQGIAKQEGDAVVINAADMGMRRCSAAGKSPKRSTSLLCIL